MRGNLWKCAREQIRPCTAEENLGAELVQFLSKDMFPTREPPPRKDARLKPERKYHTKAAVAIGKLKHNSKIGSQQMHGLLKRSGFTTKEIQAAWMEVAAEDETRKAEAVARDAAQKARTASRKVDPVTGFPAKTAEAAQKIFCFL